MDNYILLGVTNEGKVLEAFRILEREPSDTEFRIVQGRMSQKLGKGKRDSWYFRTEKLTYHPKEATIS